MKKLRKILTVIGDMIMIAIVLIFLFLLLACVPLTADQIADREYNDDLTREKYYACKDAWASVGNVWYETVHSSDRYKREPSPIDMRVATKSNGCAPYLRALGY